MAGNEAKLPSYANSLHFIQLAEALEIDSGQAVEFIKAVHRLAGHGKLKSILRCVTELQTRTPEQVAEILVQFPEKLRPPAPPLKKRVIKQFRQARRDVAVLPRYAWDPDSGSIESLSD